MKGKSLGKIGLEYGEEVKKRESFPKILDNIYIYIYILEKPINVNVDMEANEDNLGTKKRVSTECIEPILYFHING